jgi:hypothetical protein
MAWRRYNEAKRLSYGLYNPEQYALLEAAIKKTNAEISANAGCIVLEVPAEVYGLPVCVTFLDSGEITTGNLTLKLSHDPSHLDVSGNIVDRAYAQKIYSIFVKFMETSVFMLKAMQ